MRRLLALTLALVVGPAFADITTWYDPNGGIVERAYTGTTNGTQWAYTTSNGQWSSATAPGNMARASVTRDFVLDASKGANVAGKTAVTVASEFTGGALARAGIGIVKGGVAGILVGAALDLALKKAHLEFDALQQSMVYNPPSSPGPGPGDPCGKYRDQSVYPIYPANSGLAFDGYAMHNGVCSQRYVNVSNAPGLIIYNDLGPPDVIASDPNNKVCPNGVLFTNTRLCRQPVDDTTATNYLTPQIVNANGPQIGQNVTGGTGNPVQPSTGVVPGPNTTGIQVDKGSWPQTSGPPTSTYGPQTSTSTQSVTGPNGTTTATTTTVTQTTNVTNNYLNNSLTQNIDNKKITTVCDPAGLCSNSTEHSGSPDAESPDDKVEVCGLPGKPKCLIDETGTPTVEAGVAGMKPGSDALDKSLDDARTAITGAGDTTGKDTSWKFSFAFPSNCAPLQAWDGMTFNVCQFQPMIHDLMSMVWYSATVFLMLGMVGRTIRGGD